MSMIYIHWDHVGAETRQYDVVGEAWDTDGRKLVLTLAGGATVEFGPNDQTEYPEGQDLPRGQLIQIIPLEGPAVVANYVFHPPSDADA